MICWRSLFLLSSREPGRKRGHLLIEGSSRPQTTEGTSNREDSHIFTLTESTPRVRTGDSYVPLCSELASIRYRDGRVLPERGIHKRCGQTIVCPIVVMANLTRDEALGMAPPLFPLAPPYSTA